MKIGIYTRISFDDDVRTKRQGVERQERMCRELADARGWHVIDVYVDNNVSAGASSNTHRPEYDRMLVDLASGSIDRILVVSQDRLLRRPEQLETLFRLHDRLGIPQIECVSSGPIDVMTASGRAFARIKTIFDKAYSEYIGEKIREQKRDRAMRGLPSGGGYRAFGYQPGGLELVPEEASLIREAVDRFVRGESVRSLCRDWNSRRITTTTGRQWGPNVMAAMLQNPRIAGLRATVERSWHPPFGRRSSQSLSTSTYEWCSMRVAGEEAHRSLAAC